MPSNTVKKISDSIMLKFGYDEGQAKLSDVWVTLERWVTKRLIR